MQPAKAGQHPSRVSFRRLHGSRGASAAGGDLTVEEVLAAVGARHTEAVIFAALPSCSFKGLGLGLETFFNLRELDLSGNALSDVAALAPLPSLKSVNLAGNCLTGLATGGFAALEVLDLSYNSLEEHAMQGLGALPLLRELDISGNGLRALPRLVAGAFPMLTRLAAGQNEFTGGVLAVLAPLPQLQHLLLPANRIAEAVLPDPSAAFIQLSLLDLSNNRLSDMDAVQRLQALPCMERLLLAGNPVAGAGFGASGTISATLHRSHVGGTMRRGSLAAAAGAGVPTGPGGRRTMCQGFVAVEEASVVALKAKALAQKKPGVLADAASRPGSRASAAAPAQAELGVPGPTAAAAAAAAPGPPDVAPPPWEGAPPGSTIGTAVEQPSAVPPLPLPPASPPVQPASESLFLDWGAMAEDEESFTWQHSGSTAQGGSSARYWSTLSTAGTGASAGMDAFGGDGLLEGPGDPTVRAALALGLDPLQLPMFNGPGIRNANPAAAIKALRFALAHPAAAPSLEGTRIAGGSGSHLRLTKSALAKQRQKAGAEGVQEGGVEGRVATIDALLAAMKRRLAAVQAAMVADAAAEAEKEKEQAAVDVVSSHRSARSASQLVSVPEDEAEGGQAGLQDTGDKQQAGSEGGKGGTGGLGPESREAREQQQRMGTAQSGQAAGREDTQPVTSSVVHDVGGAGDGVAAEAVKAAREARQRRAR